MLSAQEVIESKLEKRLKEALEYNLQRLDLSDCGLNEIPEQVFNLKGLVYLNLSSDSNSDEVFRNKIEVLPSRLTELKNLKTLDVGNNNITSISPKLGLIKLKTINLSNNKIEMIPFEIAKINTLNTLDITKNPLQNIPPEIALRGLGPILNFIKELEEQDYLYEVKLILVGEGRVGKTTIAKTLSLPDYSIQDELTTEGINVTKWNIPKNEFKISDFPYIRDSFTLNIWDFGGQEIYHSTHQFFLTKRSIYLLVTEPRKEDRHDDFYYWLNIIKILGDKSPVIIVMNKCDQPTKELPISEYRNAFENVVDYYKVSCQKDYHSTIEVLKDRIKMILKDNKLLPHIGTPLPKKWVDVRVDIDNLLQSGKDYINYKEYLDICKKHFIFNTSATYLSEFFHDLGVILHFKDDINLKDLVILNNEWVTKGVYKILDNNKIHDNHGIFTLSDVEDIWIEPQYKDKRKELISLMKNTKFELIFELSEGRYLAPQLLPVDEIKYEWRSNTNNLLFEFRYKFMPKGILTRTIVKRNQDIYQNTYWRYGVLLEYEYTRAIVRERYLENKIIIRIEGNHKRELLSIIRKSIHEIHNEYNNIDVDEMVPCNCLECKLSNDPHFYKYATLRRYVLREKQEITCEKSLLNVNIRNILTDSIIEQTDSKNPNQNTTSMPNININIDTSNKNEINNEVNIQISNEVLISINGLISELENLKEEFKSGSTGDESKTIDSEFSKIEPAIENLKSAKNKSDIDKTKLSKIKIFLEKVSNGTSKVNDLLKKIDGGLTMIKSLAKYYNSIADWTGLPQVPKILLGQDK
jgi:internalin A